MSRCPAPDMLVAYGEGVLPGDMETSVGEHLASCRVCARLREDLRESPIAEPTLAELDRLRQRMPARTAPPRRIRIAAVGAIAAALVAGVYFWPESTQPDRQVAATVPPEPKPVYKLDVKPAPLRLPLATALVLRGEAASPKKEDAFLKQLGEALEPYRAGRYTDAAQRLHALAQQYPRAVEPPFYEGVARLLAGDSNGALPSLEAARSIGGEALDDDISWYLAAAHERNRDWERAAPLLGKLCTAEGQYREAACQALRPR